MKQFTEKKILFLWWILGKQRVFCCLINNTMTVAPKPIDV